MRSRWRTGGGALCHLRTGYCWRTLLAVIWTALVAQEGASNANGEAHAGAAAVVVQTWPLGDLIGVRQQYRTLKQDTYDHLQIPPQTGRFLFLLAISPITISTTR